MNSEFAFLVWFLVLIVVYIILKYNHVNSWSSFIFAVLISYIFLVVCREDPNKCHKDCEDDDEKRCGEKKNDLFCFNKGFFAFISIVTFILIIIYIFQRVFADRHVHTIEEKAM